MSKTDKVTEERGTGFAHVLTIPIGVMDSSQIVALIDKEITWCLEHPATNLPKQFQSGFVAGLKQAKTLIEQGEKAIKSDLDDSINRFMGLSKHV